MNEIQRLIQEMCPDGVPMVALGEVCDDIFSGATPSTSKQEYWKEGIIPWMSSGEVHQGTVTVVEKRITQLGYDSCSTKMVPVGSVVIALAGQGKTRGTVARTRTELCTNQSLCSIVGNSQIVDNDFIYYFLSSQYQQLRTVSSGDGTRGGLNLKMINAYKIPLPPLPIQQRIVETLDKFTSLVSSLDSEIALRQKQYEYYRNKLLTFEEGEEGVVWKKLRDVCNVINGRAYKQSELLDKGPYRVLRVGNFFSNDSWYYSDLELESKYYCVNGDLLYAWSASFGPHIWTEEKVIYHYHIWKLECQEPLDKKFMFYWLQSENMTSQVSSEKHGATMAHLTKAMMEDLTLPIPSLSCQHSIVRTLDTFESLLTNLKKERALRQKQYEYYREKLLTFA